MKRMTVSSCGVNNSYKAESAHCIMCIFLLYTACGFYDGRLWLLQSTLWFYNRLYGVCNHRLQRLYISGILLYLLLF